MPAEDTTNSLAARIVGHYERHARAWDADRNAPGWNDKPWLDRFIFALPAGASVLDIGCGGGSPVARHLVNNGCSVTGIDTSPTLISLCRERMPEQVWTIADMRSLALKRTFDGVLAWDSFFHLNPDDQRAMFEVFAAHAGASAVLMFNAGPAHGTAIGAYKGDPLYHASLDPDEYETLLVQSGFKILAHALEDWQTGGGRTVWLAQSSR
jgi:SAM-dependent methyltransferase